MIAAYNINVPGRLALVLTGLFLNYGDNMKDKKELAIEDLLSRIVGIVNDTSSPYMVRRQMLIEAANRTDSTIELSEFLSWFGGDIETPSYDE